jgi:transcription elongation factor GreA
MSAKRKYGSRLMATPIQRVPMTASGKQLLEQELAKIKSHDRPMNIKAIEEARAHGDLSENAEFSAAKEQQGQIDARMRLLEDALARAEVITPGSSKPQKVIFGVLVKAIDADSEKEINYRLVGEFESKPEENRISYTSPIGQAFIGKAVGDEVIVKTPGGTRTYEIIDIEN